MSNMVTTSIDTGLPEFAPGEFEDRVLTVTGPKVVKAGTILARSVANPAKFLIYVKGGAADGNGIAAAVLGYEVEKSTAGSGDIPVRPMVSGTVNKRRLVIDADGNSNNVDGVVMDALRARGFTVTDVSQASG